MSIRKWIACALVALLLAFGASVLPACSSAGKSGDTGQQQAAQQAADEGGDGASATQGQGSSGQGPGASDGTESAAPVITEDGVYTGKDEVAAYIHEFGHLPSNYISKTKAKEAGWVSNEGNLDEVCPGMSIGGGTFYNDDGLLPDAAGREWKECDIDYDGGYRNEKRIVYSNDGLVFYTGDHYATFEQLY